MSSPLLLETTPAGNDLDIQRDVPGITVSDPLVLAWLTIKVRPTDTDVNAALQKSITTAQVVGVGQITQDGSESNGNGTGSLYFQLTAADTTALGVLIRYYWDIQAKTASGKIFTTYHPTTLRTVGRLQLKRRITLAAS